MLGEMYTTNYYCQVKRPRVHCVAHCSRAYRLLLLTFHNYAQHALSGGQSIVAACVGGGGIVAAVVKDALRRNNQITMQRRRPQIHRRTTAHINPAHIQSLMVRGHNAARFCCDDADVTATHTLTDFAATNKQTAVCFSTCL